MLYKRVKKKNKIKKFIYIVIILVVLIFTLFELYIKPLEIKILENRAKVLVEDRISEIADDVISSKEYNYDNLLK